MPGSTSPPNLQKEGVEDEPETSGGGGGMSEGRVLVADDEDLVREAVRELLEAYGFDIVGEAEDGSDAVRLADELRPDVVLMDMRMPVMDGIAATAEIRGKFPDVQVIMLSAYDDPGFQRGAEEAGALCYLVKGVGGGLLRDVLRSAVNTARGLAMRRSAAEPKSA